MRTPKKLLLAGALFCGSLAFCPVPAALAQSGDGNKETSGEYRVKLPNSSDQKVHVLMDQGNVKIEGYDGDEVVVRAPGRRTETPERAKGLRPIYYSAEDNSGLGLSVVKDGNTLRITKASRHHGEYAIRVPRKVKLEFEQANWSGIELEITGLAGDLEVKTNNSDIELKNVSGPVVASTTSGNITVVYANVGQDRPSSISNISGVVDVTLPANAKADLKLKSISGEIYSDMDIAMRGSKENLPRLGGGNTVEGTLNGGGVEINLNTISSDIYLRKQK